MNEIKKEISLENYPLPVTIDGTIKILNQLKNCICKIKNKKGSGTGFFCSLPNNIKVMITNNHVINEDILKENEIIEISLNDNKEYKKIILKNKTIYTNKEYDITIIEISEKDKINDYLELDENIFRDNINEFKQSIYILQYPKYLYEQKASVSYGVIKDIEEYNIYHLCSK